MGARQALLPALLSLVHQYCTLALQLLYGPPPARRAMWGGQEQLLHSSTIATCRSPAAQLSEILHCARRAM